MCGRYILKLTSFEVSAQLDYAFTAPLDAYSDIRPTNSVNIVRDKGEKVKISFGKWGRLECHLPSILIF